VKLPQFKFSLHAERWWPATQWFLAGALIIGLFIFSAHKQADRPIPEIRVEIGEQSGLHFIDNKAIYEHVQSQVLADVKANQGPATLHLGRIERNLMRNPYIASIDISQDLEGKILVDIEQSRPIARIIDASRGDFYISSLGKLIPVSPLYTARVLLLEGPGARRLAERLPKQSRVADSANATYIDLITRLEKDEFWRAQASSLLIDARGEVSIIPTLGNHRIELGLPSDLDSKFTRLNAFYQRILPSKGWSRYSFVSVKYQHQIICK
jgi:cell division protein FtsQ